MAKRKGNRKGKVPPHLRKYLFKKGRKAKNRRGRKTKGRKTRARKRSTTMAKRKGRKTKSRSTRRTTRRRGRRRSGGGGGYGLMPSREDIKTMAASAGIGFLEGKAKDPNFFVTSIVAKSPIAALGYTGNLALILYVLSHFVKNKWLRLGAKSAANIAAYQLGRKGSPFGSASEVFSISGWSDDDVAMALQQQMGALSAAGDGGMPGVPNYDEALAQYGEYGD